MKLTKWVFLVEFNLWKIFIFSKLPNLEYFRENKHSLSILEKPNFPWNNVSTLTSPVPSSFLSLNHSLRMWAIKLQVNQSTVYVHTPTHPEQESCEMWDDTGLNPTKGESRKQRKQDCQSHPTFQLWPNCFLHSPFLDELFRNFAREEIDKLFRILT